jgi:hypothetical protein
MADYPNSLPLLQILFDRIDKPRPDQFNDAYREIEAICTELGINPSTINDSTTPTASPASVAVLLDMYANIIKNMCGVSSWIYAACPNRRILAGCGNGDTVPAGSTRYLYPGLTSLATTEYFVPVLWDGNAVKFCVRLSAAQPGTGSLVFTLRKQHNYDGGSDTGTVLTIAAGSAAGTYSISNSIDYHSDVSRKPGSYYPGWTQEGIDALSIKVVNNASGASAGIAGWSLEYDQVTIGTQAETS